MARYIDAPATTHGLSKTPEYLALKNAIDRCTNPNHSAYKNYGARGIRVCRRWNHVSKIGNFLDDMGARPSPKHQLDRIDNSKGYSPSNCKWSTSKQNNNNKRSNRLITFRGKTLTIRQWAKKSGISYENIVIRLCLGWSVKHTLTIPKGQRRPQFRK